MNHKEIAERLIDLLGGEDNIISAAHCATRLRLVIKDESKIDQEKVEALDGVKGAFSSSGQYQIIFGTGLVNKVYEQFAKMLQLDQKETVQHNEAAKQKMNPLARFAKTLSNIFVPIIPAIVASGLLMGLLGMMKAFQWVSPDSGLFKLLDMFSSAAFIILPILIGVSAAKEFGGNPYLGAVIGGILIHPSLLNPWGLAEAKPEVLNFLGMPIEMLGYQGTVIPILLAVYVMSKIEKWTRKIVPNAIDLLVTPFLTIISTGFIAFIVIGPLGRGLGTGITNVLTFVYDHAYPVAGLIFGGAYSLIVLTGVHHSFHAIEVASSQILDATICFRSGLWPMSPKAVQVSPYFSWQNGLKQKKSLCLLRSRRFSALQSRSSSESTFATVSRSSVQWREAHSAERMSSLQMLPQTLTV